MNREIQTHSQEAGGRSMSYRELDQLQRQIHSRILAGGAGALLLAEVNPVITCGRRTVDSDILLPEETLRTRGIDLFRTDRGGLATYHGPGQWILFPVERLEVLTGDSRGVRKAVEALLETALEVAQKFDPEAKIEWGDRTGVWSRTGKYASVGIHIERGVLLHGLALNVYRTPESFMGLRPCGLDVVPSFLAETVEWKARSGWDQAPELRRLFAETGRHLVEVAGRRLSSKAEYQEALTPRKTCVKPDTSIPGIGA